VLSLPRRWSGWCAAAALLLCAASPAAAQTRRARIVGRVTDADSKQPLANATVSVVGTAYGVATQADGRFVLGNLPSGVFNLEVRRVGYGLVRIDNLVLRNDSTTVQDVALSSNPLRLNQVVVSGSMDATQSSKLPFSIAKITAEDIPVPPNMSAAGAIQGKVASARINRARGPGAGVFVQLRTPTSQFNSNSPLFVVDGVILNSQIGGTTVDIDNLDIASIEVIKGAAGATLYGSRGANGVILITTNRGNNIPLGTSRVSVRSEFGQNQFGRNVPRPTTHQYRVNAQGQYVNAAGAVVPRTQRVLDPNGIMDNAYIDPLFDNVSALYRAGNFLTNTFTLEQNSASTNFVAAFSRYGEQGVVIDNPGFVRNNVRLNVDHRISDKFRIALSGTHVRQKQTPNNVSFADFYRINPDVDLRQPGPDFGVRVTPDSTDASRINPLYRNRFNQDTTSRVRTLLSADVRYTPRSWLAIDGTMSYDRADETDDLFEPAGVPDADNLAAPSLGEYELFQTQNQSVNATLGATVTREWRGLTSRWSVRGWSEQETFREVISTGTQFTVTGVRRMNVSAVQGVRSQFTDRRTDRVQSTLNFDYRGKYILDGAVTRDGSSLFGPAARWNTFGRLGGTYRVSEETWFPGKSFFSNVGLRYVMGQAGTRPGFADQYEVLGVGTGGTITRQSLGNRFLRPEIAQENEAGLDLVIRNRYSLQLGYIRSRTRNNQIAIPVPGLTGFNTQARNVGGIAGRTWEATIQTQWINRGKFKWDMNLVLDRTRNNITGFNRSCFTDGILNRCDGTLLGEMWGNQLARTEAELPAVHRNSLAQFQRNDDGYLVPVGAGNSWTDGIAKGLWGTNVVVDGVTYRWGHPVFMTNADGTLQYRVIGNANPDVNIGWGNTFRYGNLRLYGLFTGQVGGNIYNQARQTMYNTASHGDLDQSGKADERRKPVTYYVVGLARNNTNYGSDFVERGTYMKLAELQLAYTFPQRVPLLSRWGADRLQLEVNGRNMLIFTRYRGVDPEQTGGTGGVPAIFARADGTGYPLYRTVTTALNISF
jgi:TonB-linked SusC/RagA family outer membrane protein